MLVLNKLYKTLPEFKNYVDAYCQHRGLRIEQALRHKTVEETARYYIDEMKDKLDDNIRKIAKELMEGEK